MSALNYIITGGQAVPLLANTVAPVGQVTNTLTNGLNSNVPTNGLPSLRLVGPAGAFSVGGLAPAAGTSWQPGQVVTVINTTSQPMTIVNEDVSSTAANRITVSGGVGYTYLNGYATATFVYDGATDRFKLQNDGLNYPRVYDVRTYGAVCDGVTDDSTAINTAISAAAANYGGDVFVPGPCAIASTVHIGSASSSAYGVTLRGPKRPINVTNHTLIWTGAAGGTMVNIRQAYGGCIQNVCLDGNNVAAYGLQFQHMTGDVSVVEHWEIVRCAFTNCTTYNVLIGDIDANDYVGDNSAIAFHNCMFIRSYIGAPTVAHVRHRSQNSLGNSFYSCQFDGNGTYPSSAISAEGGNPSLHGCIDVGMGTVAYWLTTPAFNDVVPAGISFTGHSSQSANLLKIDADKGGGAAAQYPIVLTGVCHQDIVGSGTYSVQMNRGEYATLTINGGLMDRGVSINTFGAGILLSGPCWAAARGGASITGSWAYTASGTWTVDGANFVQLFAYSTSTMKLNGPLQVIASGGSANPALSVGQAAGLQLGQVAITLTTGTLDLRTDTRANFPYLWFTGTLSGNVTILLPATVGGSWTIDASYVTLGAYTITLQANSVNWGTTITNALIYQVIYTNLGKLAGKSLTI